MSISQCIFDLNLWCELHKPNTNTVKLDEPLSVLYNCKFDQLSLDYYEYRCQQNQLRVDLKLLNNEIRIKRKEINKKLLSRKRKRKREVDYNQTLEIEHETYNIKILKRRFSILQSTLSTLFTKTHKSNKNKFRKEYYNLYHKQLKKSSDFFNDFAVEILKISEKDRCGQQFKVMDMTFDFLLDELSHLS